MSFRKRRRPTPGFGVPPPFSPIQGKFAGLNEEGEMPCCAMMQVIEEDTYDNYVVCRGYDPLTKEFYNSISVAKPYGQRGQTGIYAVGEVHPAVKPIGKLGFNPGKAETSTGHPADLDEEVVKLQDDDSVDIQWMFIGSGSASHFGKLDSDLAYSNSSGVLCSIYTDPDTDSGVNITVVPPKWMTYGTWPTNTWVQIEKWGSKYIVIGAWISQQVLTAINITNGKVRVKTRNVMVFINGPESDWTDASGQSSVGTQYVLTDFQVSGNTVQTKKREVYVNPVGAESDWETKHTGTNCQT